MGDMFYGQILAQTESANAGKTVTFVSTTGLSFSGVIDANGYCSKKLPAFQKYRITIDGVYKDVDLGCGDMKSIYIPLDKTTFAGVQNILNMHRETEQLEIGDTIRTTLASQEEVDFQIAAINHNNEALHSVIWVAKNTLLDPKVHNSVGQTYMTWRNSAVRSFLNNTFYNSLQDDIKPYVKERTTMTAINGGSSGLNTDVDKVWIPRVYEAYGSGGPAQEHSSGGAELFPIFTSGANRQKCVGISGTVPVKWLLASPSPNKYSSTSYYPWSYEMDTNGVYATYGNNYAGSEYVVPCWLQVADS